MINNGTIIVTFLMVFLIQNSQNRDSAAIQVKLDELIRVSMAQNSFVGIEHLTDDELEEIRTNLLAEKEATSILNAVRAIAEHLKVNIAPDPEPEQLAKDTPGEDIARDLRSKEEEQS